jgi:hypothetical protein
MDKESKKTKVKKFADCWLLVTGKRRTNYEQQVRRIERTSHLKNSISVDKPLCQLC